MDASIVKYGCQCNKWKMISFVKYGCQSINENKWISIDKFKWKLDKLYGCQSAINENKWISIVIKYGCQCNKWK